jgi:hypothetical protein
MSSSVIDLDRSSVSSYGLLFVEDERLLVFLAVAILIAGVILIRYLFLSAHSRPAASAKRVLIQSIQEQYYDLLARTRDLSLYNEPLKMAHANRRALEIQVATEAVSQHPELLDELHKKLGEVEAVISQREMELRTELDKLRLEAQDLAEHIVETALPATLDTASTERTTFFLEFVTVVIIIVSILILSLLGIFTGEQVAPLLASIAGYVLGRSVSDREAKHK